MLFQDMDLIIQILNRKKANLIDMKLLTNNVTDVGSA